jgi:PKD repeat protein
VLGPSIARAQAPGTDFTATPTAGCGPLDVQFTDESTNGPLFWSWDFGNGATSNVQNPSNTYTAPGTYTVTLIARNKSGANVMRKTNFIMVYPAPTPTFISNLTLACAPAAIQFTDQSTPGQGTDIAWAWDFGDGNSSTQQNPTNTYTQPGYYNVTLKVTNSGGCSNSAGVVRFLRIIGGIQPNFTWDQVSTSCTAPYVLNFLNQTAGPGTLSYSWNLGNGANPASSTATNPAGITYPANGQYTVALQVQSSYGCSATFQQTLPLSGSGVVYNGPTVVCANTPATFSNGSNPLGSTTWSFGDGTPNSDSANTTHTFLYANTYNVKLVNRNPGCADSVTQAVQVVNPPTPAFTANATSGCKAPLTVNFTDQSTGGPFTNWSWDFGDGQTGTGQNPSHTYNATGSFDVKLTVTGPGNCPQTITQKGYITIQAPTVSINNSGGLGACIASTATFNTLYPTSSVTSVDPVSAYSWTAPGSNEGSSTSAYPGFTYNTAGNYTLSLTVTTAGGCTASTSSPVTIGLPVIPTISPNPASICGRYRTVFTATNPQGQDWAWSFGDGTTDTVNRDTAPSAASS